MPEMPEVESIVVGIRSYVEKRKIIDIEVIKGDVIKYPTIEKYKQSIKNKVIETLERRGKYIIMKLSDDMLNVIHLRMTGKLLYQKDIEVLDKYSCIIYHLDNGNRLVYADIRRLGTLDLINETELSRLKGLANLGAEPLSKDFTVDYLQQCLVKSKGKIKPLLLNQKYVAGLGNIYVDEALAISKIHPERMANTLSKREIIKLHEAINIVISEGIRDGGTSFRDYRNGLGEKGAHQDKLYVYNRQGQKCRFCQSKIIKIILNGRGTHFCPECQKLEEN